MIEFKKKRRKTIQKKFLIFLKAEKGKRKQTRKRKKQSKLFLNFFQGKKEKAKVHLF